MQSIDTLVAQYSQLVEVPRLALPDGHVLVNPATQQAIYDRMFNASLWPLPPVNYQTRVLKMILSRLEESISDPEEDEIIDPLMTTWASLLSQPKPDPVQQAQQLSYIKYTAHTTGKTVITSESRGLILSSGTTGFRTWEAALHLGTFLSTPAGRDLVKGKRVVELGAGTGFLSLYCAMDCGVESVVVTDRDPALIENISDCVKRNSVEGVVFPGIWEWGTPLQDPGIDPNGGKAEFDVAIGADLIYDTDLIPLLLSTVTDLFENYRIKDFIISATLRNQDTFQTFLNACESNNFTAECLPFESPSSESQTGFFHSTDIPIRTYRICRS